MRHGGRCQSSGLMVRERFDMKRHRVGMTASASAYLPTLFGRTGGDHNAHDMPANLNCDSGALAVTTSPAVQTFEEGIWVDSAEVSLPLRCVCCACMQRSSLDALHPRAHLTVVAWARGPALCSP
ncbi:hypothetical protein CBOM_08099 [Ceraceosorus bombacis]|uniref:Uncharacterized protein n=1 Tax=Ceraceosorus bombacis TaxID=401625 RepID=A0A0P1BKV8_9BASI|nr:hypothetical protein CBOM_08099 [Ceraceosorus bombacis]